MSSPTGTSSRRGKDKKREETPDENLEASDSYIQAREGALAVAKYFKLDVREDLDGQVTASAKKKTTAKSDVNEDLDENGKKSKKKKTRTWWQHLISKRALQIHIAMLVVALALSSYKQPQESSKCERCPTGSNDPQPGPDTTKPDAPKPQEAQYAVNFFLGPRTQLNERTKQETLDLWRALITQHALFAKQNIAIEWGVSNPEHIPKTRFIVPVIYPSRSRDSWLNDDLAHTFVNDLKSQYPKSPVFSIAVKNEAKDANPSAAPRSIPQWAHEAAADLYYDQNEGLLDNPEGKALNQAELSKLVDMMMQQIKKTE